MTKNNENAIYEASNARTKENDNSGTTLERPAEKNCFIICIFRSRPVRPTPENANYEIIAFRSFSLLILDSN